MLGRMRVGMKVIEARTGRLFFSSRDEHADGSGVEPEGAGDDDRADAPRRRLALPHRADRAGADADGIIVGDVYLRGNGDPTFRSGDLDAMAGRARPARACARIAGAVVADPRRVGADEPIADAEGDRRRSRPTPPRTRRPGKLSPRVPLVVNHGLMLIRVRPGAEPGAPAEVIDDARRPVVRRSTTARVTKAQRRSRVTVRLSVERVAHPDRRRRARVAPRRGGIALPPPRPAPGAVRGGADARVAAVGRDHRARRRARRADAAAEAGPRAAAAGGARIGAARDPAAQDQQGLGQRLRRARAGGGRRRGLRRRADRRTRACACCAR